MRFERNHTAARLEAPRRARATRRPPLRDADDEKVRDDATTRASATRDDSRRARRRARSATRAVGDANARGGRDAR